jgi:hypothetical protein
LLGLPQNLEYEIVRDMVYAALKDGMIELVWDEDHNFDFHRVRASMYVGKLRELEGHRVIEPVPITDPNNGDSFVTHTGIRRF